MKMRIFLIKSVKGGLIPPFFFLEELDQVGYKKKKRGINGLFIVFTGNFLSSPKAFVGDPMFPVEVRNVIWAGSRSWKWATAPPPGSRDRGGLKEGDWVISHPTNKIEEGVRVNKK